MKEILTRPNRSSRRGDGDIQPYELGDNQLALRFNNRAFAILLNPDYYEGTEYGQYYNTIENGKSTIYVDQVETERALKLFWKSDSNSIKYLVGYTGIGKTTVIRNVFKIFDRDVHVVENSLIIYHSFYSMHESITSDVKNQVWNSYKNTIIKTIAFLSGKTTEEFFLSIDDAFYKDFYNFIKNNNPNMASSYSLAPKKIKKLHTDDYYEVVLNDIEEKHEQEYYLLLLKYYIQLYQKNIGEIENVIFIFDDIEAQKVEYHIEAIDMAYDIKNCISAFKGKSFDIKILISLRNYVFRLNQERQKAAFREIPDCDYILKTEAPMLSEVLEKRTKAIVEHPKTIRGIVKIDSWKKASDSLMSILQKMYGNYDAIILNLTHYNLFKSMQLLLRIITNKRYLGKYETYDKNGSFIIEPKIYDLSNKDKNVITNSDVFNSLVYGEGEHYFDYGDYYLSNILHYSRSDYIHSRILKLYILRYFEISQSQHKNTLYGVNYEKGSDVISNIHYVFKDENASFSDQLKLDLSNSIAYLYTGGVLLQSIKDVEHEDDCRQYHDDDLLYLSLRGAQLISMLKSNALLFEAYRNDIDTNITNNNMPSVRLSKVDSLLYCIEYTKQLFESEKHYISNIKNTYEYFLLFGHDLIVSSLVDGLKNSIEKLYLTTPDVFIKPLTMLNQLINTINDYIDSTKKEKNIRFEKIELLEV